MPAEAPEASGLSESLLHPGFWYFINDSPDEFQTALMRPTGEIAATINLVGVEYPENFTTLPFMRTGDMEAIVVGPCSDGGAAATCVFVGDTGNNCMRESERRKGCHWYRPDGLYSVIRFREPELPPPGSTLHVEAERFWFRFGHGDGPYDVETLLMTPGGGLHLVTKVDRGGSGLYFIPPLRAGETVTAVRLGDIPPPSEGSNLFSDGAVHHDGAEVLGVSLLTYTHVWYYARGPGDALADALARAPCFQPHPDLPQSECIGWDHSAAAYLVGSEGPGTDIFRVPCRPVPPASTLGASRSHAFYTVLFAGLALACAALLCCGWRRANISGDSDEDTDTGTEDER